MRLFRIIAQAARASPGGARGPKGFSSLRVRRVRLPPSATAKPWADNATSRILFQRRPFFASNRAQYNYDPRHDPRYRQDETQQQSKPPKVFQGIPVRPSEVPPAYTFEHSGYNGRSSFRRAVTSTSMQTVVALSMAAALLFYFANLEVVPVSGRRRFNCLSDDTIRMLGQLQYEQLLQEAHASGQRFLPDYDPRTMVVRDVLARLIPVSGMANELSDWEIVVIDDPHVVNAFVLPGCKVFVYSGIFNAARNEDAVATVLGHELAHNLANHHGERASSAIGSTLLSWSAFVLTMGLSYFFLNHVIDVVFNAPMSRKQESEADFIGLMLMADACFDPTQALGFWQRVDQTQQLEPPEWVSTHPSNQHRIDKIKEWMPAALEKRQQSACNGTQDFAERFKRALRNGIILGL